MLSSRVNATTLRLTGVVSERPAVNPPHQELRELIAENDRLIERNKKLKRERDQALDLVAKLEASRGQERLRKLGELTAVSCACADYPAALVVGRLRLNYAAQRLERNGQSVYLPFRSMELLSHLMSRPDEVVPTNTLARLLGFDKDHRVRTLVGRARDILAAIGARDYLCSHGAGRGSGYWMTNPEPRP